jgi:glycosyltransferase involved in cell wall biosynthesis
MTVLVDAVLNRESSSRSRGALRSVAFIGTYVPRRCGIATFTDDLVTALVSVPQRTEIRVVALNDTIAGYPYPDHVDFEINQNHLRDYSVAADYLNTNRIDVACVQHEFGIYGGPDGAHILKLIQQLRMPVVTTLHTILKDPTPSQKKVVADLASLSDRIVTMSETGRRFLVEIYGLDSEQITLVPHGIPDMPFVDPSFYKDQFGVEGKKVILTFGLLSPNKGIENVIRALPRIAERHGDVVYIVLGTTHPHVRKVAGEEYRHSLEQLALDLGVEDRVIFKDRYVTITELCEFLGAADIFVTSYLNEDQIVSGTLAYALGAGKAVVSTPYWHASEILAEGRGRLVPFGDHRATGDAIIELFDDETAHDAMRKRAYTYSQESTWHRVGSRYMEIFTEVCRERERKPKFSPELQRNTTFLPDIDLSHLRRLTDSTGILQHAVYFVPNRDHGYCTDDNARALIVTTLAEPHLPGGSGLAELNVRYLAFLQHAFDRKRGVFRNFMSYDRRWIDDGRSTDNHGRAIWALSTAGAKLADERLRVIACNLLHDALPAMEHAIDTRTISFALLGLVRYLIHYEGDSAAKRMRDFLVSRLWDEFERNGKDPEWLWPEDRLTYANARLPHALLKAGHQIDREDMVQAALRSLAWLMKVQTAGERFSPVGNAGWYPRGGTKALFDQQPIEADASVAACVAAFEITGDRRWFDRALLAFQWFLGRNDLKQPLYDHATGGCRDGLSPAGPNENQGAESTLVWLSSLIQMHVLQAAGELLWEREREVDRLVQTVGSGGN